MTQELPAQVLIAFREWCGNVSQADFDRETKHKGIAWGTGKSTKTRNLERYMPGEKRGSSMREDDLDDILSSWGEGHYRYRKDPERLKQLNEDWKPRFEKAIAYQNQLIAEIRRRRRKPSPEPIPIEGEIQSPPQTVATSVPPEPEEEEPTPELPSIEEMPDIYRDFAESYRALKASTSQRATPKLLYVGIALTALGLIFMLGGAIFLVLSHLPQSTPSETLSTGLSSRSNDKATPQVTKRPVTVEVTRLATVIMEKEVTREVEVTRVVAIPVDKIVKETVEKRVTVPVQQTVVVVVAPSVTPVPPPTAVTMLFEDNFDKGLNPEWRISDGEWHVANEVLVTNPSRIGQIAIGDASWVNYVIDLDYFNCSRCELSVRTQDNRDRMMVTFGNFIAAKWHLCQNDNCRVLGEGPASPPTGHLKVEVRDDYYVMYADGRKISSLFDKTLSSGGVSLSYVQAGYPVWFDNFKVSPLP